MPQPSGLDNTNVLTRSTGSKKAKEMFQQSRLLLRAVRKKLLRAAPFTPVVVC